MNLTYEHPILALAWPYTILFYSYFYATVNRNIKSAMMNRLNWYSNKNWKVQVHPLAAYIKKMKSYWNNQDTVHAAFKKIGGLGLFFSLTEVFIFGLFIFLILVVWNKSGKTYNKTRYNSSGVFIFYHPPPPSNRGIKYCCRNSPKILADSRVRILY